MIDPKLKIVGLVRNVNQTASADYRERAEIALPLGVALVDIPVTKHNIVWAQRNGPIDVRYWDGTALLQLKIPIPAVVYDRVDVRGEGREPAVQFLRTIKRQGTIVFNSERMRGVCADKWRSYKILLKSDVPTPETRLFTSASAIEMLEQHGMIFIKPRSASHGKGQYTVRRRGKKFLIKSGDESFKCTREQAHEFMRFLAKEKSVAAASHIVQRGVRVMRVNDRVCDFRTIFHRGLQGHISMTVAYMRAGAEGSLQSNINAGGAALDPAIAMGEDWPELYECLRELGTGVMLAMGSIMTVAECGLDIVVDQDGDLLVIEMNSKPGSKGLRILREMIADDTPDNGVKQVLDNETRKRWGQSLYDFISRPIMYASYLHDVLHDSGMTESGESVPENE